MLSILKTNDPNALKRPGRWVKSGAVDEQGVCAASSCFTCAPPMFHYQMVEMIFRYLYMAKNYMIE